MRSWWAKVRAWVHRWRWRRAIRRMTRDGRTHGVVAIDTKGLPQWASAPAEPLVGHVEEVLGEDEDGRQVVTIRIGGGHG